ncbi:ABC transporter permease [Kaarinaea lacus]
MIRLSFRLLRRDWKSGELRILLAALLIAVTCVTSVSFFTSRIGQALDFQSSELLGGDLRLITDHPVPAVALELAKENSLQTAETRSFRSMILSEGKPQLVEIKAAGTGYPLRGRLRTAESRYSQDEPAYGLPESGTVWVDSRLLQLLNASVGDEVQVGNMTLSISAMLSYEPDRSGDMFSLAPRLLMNLDDLPETGLEQEGSRMRYALLVAGEQDFVDRYRQQLKSKLQRGERLEGVADARQEIRIALSRAQQFLGLAAVVAVVLACVAIAMAARQYAQRHLDTCAIMRCLGAIQNQIILVFILQLVFIGMAAGAAGVTLGYFAQSVLTSLLGKLLLVSLPEPSFLPVLTGMCVSFIGLIGFALPPILRLRNASALKVFNRDFKRSTNDNRSMTMLSYLPGLLVLAGLVLIQANDLKLGLWLVLGLFGAAVLLWFVSSMLIWSLRFATGHANSAWRFGLVNLTRRSNTSVIQIMSFGLGLMVLLLLTVVRGDLLRGWSEGLPTDAPNRFVINIQSSQVNEVRSFLSQEGLKAAKLYPMIRGRLVKINDEEIRPEKYGDQRAKNLVTREFNLSWADTLQEDNEIVDGQWWDPSVIGKNLFSVEEGIAKTLGISVGDTLTYDIAGQDYTATVASLRTVQWDSMKANFFVLSPPGVMDGFPASYITSFYLPNSKVQVLDRLVKTFPNLTVIDIAAILSQVRLIIERVSLAVEYVFVFTLAAGLTVMYAAIQSSLDERLKENAIMRALGATRRRLWKGLAAEFVTLGSLAGLLAAVLASALGFGIANYVLELDYITNPWLWIGGLLLGGLGVGLAGILGTRQVINSPPLKVLRRG